MYIVGFLIILVAVVLVCFEVIWRPKAGSMRLGGVAATAVALGFIGYLLITLDSTTEVKFGNIGSIHKAVRQAENDAKTIAELRSRVEGQSATIDAIAGQARQSRDLSDIAGQQVKQLDRKTSQFDSILGAARSQLDKLKTEIEFANRVQSANNDSRTAFDSLLKQSLDPLDPFQARALAAYSAVYRAHNQSFSNNYNIQGAIESDISKLTISELIDNFAVSDAVSRLAIIQRINGRSNTSLLLRSAFDIEVIKTSLSLNEIEVAVRGIDQINNLQFGPLNIDGVLDWWNNEPIKEKGLTKKIHRNIF